MRIYLGSGKENGIDFSISEWLFTPRSKLNPDLLMISNIDGATLETCKQEKYVFKKGVTLTLKNENNQGFAVFDENGLL